MEKITITKSKMILIGSIVASLVFGIAIGAFIGAHEGRSRFSNSMMIRNGQIREGQTSGRMMWRGGDAPQPNVDVNATDTATQ